MRNERHPMEKIKQMMEARRTAAEILDVGESAEGRELKEAYRKAAVQYHPDRNGNTPESNKRFLLIRCAYEMLAFDKPCRHLLEEIDGKMEKPEIGNYRTDNVWGRFLWWRENFFDPENKEKNTKKSDERTSCI